MLRVSPCKELHQGADSQQLAAHQPGCGAVSRHVLGWPEPRAVCKCVSACLTPPQWQSSIIYCYSSADRQWVLCLFPSRRYQNHEGAMCELHTSYSQRVLGSHAVRLVVSLYGSVKLGLFVVGFFCFFLLGSYKSDVCHSTRSSLEIRNSLFPSVTEGKFCPSGIITVIIVFKCCCDTICLLVFDVCKHRRESLCLCRLI